MKWISLLPMKKITLANISEHNSDNQNLHYALSQKFIPPQPYHHVVIRQNLLNKIFQQNNHNIIIIQAPAGHGKTTLLQQSKIMSEEQSILTSWLNFDETDNDVQRFTLHIQLLIQNLSSENNNKFFLNIQQSLNDWVIHSLTQLKKKVHLFFDEFQNIHNPVVLQLINGLLECIPNNVVVFISSRTISEIGLSRLIVNNKALILKADDLRFSPKEAESFFTFSSELKINSDELDIIYQRTEGWPAALQLFRLSLVNPSIRQSLESLSSYRLNDLAEYLAENVLLLQSPKTQEFLLYTSVFTKISAPLCDAIFDWHDSQQTLFFLEKSGLFLRAIDTNYHWFKYHSIFATFLSEQLKEKLPEIFLSTHQLAAQWFVAHSMNEEAMYHAMATNDHFFAITILSQWSNRLIASGFLMTVEYWSDQLPLSEIVQHPEFAIKISWALSFLRKHHKLNLILTSLEQISIEHNLTQIIRSIRSLCLDNISLAFNIIQNIDLVPSGNTHLQDFYTFELAAAANIYAYYALCYLDFNKAYYYLNLAKSYNLQSGAEFSSGYTASLFGMNYFLQGRLSDALSLYTNTLKEHKTLNQSVAVAAMASCYAHALYEHNDLNTTEQIFIQYQEKISSTALLDFLAVGYISIIRTYQTQGRLDEAENMIDEVNSLAHSAGWPRLIRILLWERIRYALILKDIARAKTLNSYLVAQPDFLLSNNGLLYSDAFEGDAICRIRLAIHSGEFDEAKNVLSITLKHALDHNCTYRIIKLSILKAILYQQLNQKNLAEESLIQSLKLARPEGYIRVFLDEGEIILPLLDSVDLVIQNSKESKLHLFIKYLKSKFIQDSSNLNSQINSPSQKVLDSLTEKEKQILMHLANGISNKQIAKHIFVSENTIKFHLKNIYTKLNVKNRLQAINVVRKINTEVK